MLFRKKITPACCYCQRGTALEDGYILCAKRGIVLSDQKCRRFRYDPCKRIPPKMKALNLEKYEQADFSL